MIKELEKEELEVVASGIDPGVKIGIWNEWKWPPARPPVRLEGAATSVVGN